MIRICTEADGELFRTKSIRKINDEEIANLCAKDSESLRRCG